MKMKANIYTFMIEYEACNKIWRTVEVSDQYSLAKLGYLILASFDTLANHLFCIEHKGVQYEIPMDEDDYEDDFLNPLDYRLCDIKMDYHSILYLIYDYGCEQVFTVRLLSVEEMEKGTSKNYPRVTGGEGKGILDDVIGETFKNKVNYIDKTGKSNYTYLAPSGEYEPWDYREYDIINENKTLKNRIFCIQHTYED